MEAIGFVALIASLVFVGLETRNSAEQSAQNARAMELAAYQELTNSIAEMNALAIESDEVATIMAGNYLFTSEAEQFQKFASLIQLFRHGDMAYFMFEKGVIDEERLKSTLRPLPLGNEVGKGFWSNYRFIFVKSYQVYIDKLIEEEFWKTPDA